MSRRLMEGVEVLLHVFFDLEDATLLLSRFSELVMNFAIRQLDSDVGDEDLWPTDGHSSNRS
jgi:hypothetical protein